MCVHFQYLDVCSFSPAGPLALLVVLEESEQDSGERSSGAGWGVAGSEKETRRERAGERLTLESEELQSRMCLSLLSRFCGPSLERTGCLGANAMPMLHRGPGSSRSGPWEPSPLLMEQKSQWSSIEIPTGSMSLPCRFVLGHWHGTFCTL